MFQIYKQCTSAVSDQIDLEFSIDAIKGYSYIFINRKQKLVQGSHKIMSKVAWTIELFASFYNLPSLSLSFSLFRFMFISIALVVI